MAFFAKSITCAGPVEHRVVEGGLESEAFGLLDGRHLLFVELLGYAPGEHHLEGRIAIVRLRFGVEGRRFYSETRPRSIRDPYCR
jgi:hypothetical protein